MKVYKFGGASVKNAEAIINLEKILEHETNEKLVVVISAMAKTTNALEIVAKEYFNRGKWSSKLEEIEYFHFQVVDGLFNQAGSIRTTLNKIFNKLKAKLNTESSLNFNFEYDQIVSYGEILSTTIISHYLNSKGIANEWIDAQSLLRTDSNYREANVNWDLSTALFRKKLVFNEVTMYVTQGFIGSDNNNLTTTLGREGSDFTAAAVAYMLDAESLTVWKDVPGVLNADPKYFTDTVKLDRISYLDAIELAYFGTSVIHPKTIQPLQKKSIRLYVKSFLEPSLPGTIISEGDTGAKIPCYIVKKNQRFLHISTKDFSFIVEAHLKEIFGVFARFGLRINIMQNSAVSFDVCVTNDETRIPQVIKELQNVFEIRDEQGLELTTIRNYNPEIVEKLLINRRLVLEQKSGENIQLVTQKTITD